MRAFIISASLVLPLTQVGPALGEDANHIVPGCRAVTDEQSLKEWLRPGSASGLLRG